MQTHYFTKISRYFQVLEDDAEAWTVPPTLGELVHSEEWPMHPALLAYIVRESPAGFLPPVVKEA